MHLISKNSSLSDGFQKQRASFMKRWRIEWFFSEPRKNIKVKHIESYKPRKDSKLV